MLEELFLRNDRGNHLSAILNNGKLDAPVLIFVHGFAGNKDENGLFIDAENYFSSKNFNVLRYDMEGVGHSEGNYESSSLVNQAKDLSMVAHYVKDKYPENKMHIIGFSLGATASLLMDDLVADSYIFWSPALFTSKDMSPRYDCPEIHREITDNGYLNKSGVKVGPRILSDLKNFDPLEYINKMNKKILLIHGTNDPRIDYNSTVMAKDLFPYADLEIIEGANHSFKGNAIHRKMLFDKTYEWLQRNN